jgi:hypothetical protein
MLQVQRKDFPHARFCRALTISNNSVAQENNKAQLSEIRRDIQSRSPGPELPCRMKKAAGRLASHFAIG